MKYTEFLKNYEEMIFVAHEPEMSDVIFVPGNNLPDMAEEAARLWKKGYAPWVLPSGRYSILTGKFEESEKGREKYCGSYETEWEFLKNVLMQNGVPEQAVLKEAQATYTYENALYSKQVLEQRNISVKKAIICCKAFHARRCQMYYQLVFPETEFYIRPVDTGINRENWFQTQEGIETVLGEAERCGSQFHKILAELQR